MKFEIFTILPEIFLPYLGASILEKAAKKGLVEFNLHNIRDYTHDSHHTTDDTPYGGGGGMVMKPEPIFEAVEGVLGTPSSTPVLLMTPQGKVFNQELAHQLAEEAQIAIICGRYEGYDERIRTGLVTHEVSIGDFVLTGGELPALLVMDAITRLLPGVLGDPTGAIDDSHSSGLLEYPHYTRPVEFRGMNVPDILLSGNHQKIDDWRTMQALQRTFEKRPDMLQKLDPERLSKKSKALWQELVLKIKNSV